MTIPFNVVLTFQYMRQYLNELVMFSMGAKKVAYVGCETFKSSTIVIISSRFESKLLFYNNKDYYSLDQPYLTYTDGFIVNQNIDGVHQPNWRLIVS